MNDKILLLPQNRAILKSSPCLNQTRFGSCSCYSFLITRSMSGSNTETLKFWKIRKKNIQMTSVNRRIHFLFVKLQLKPRMIYDCHLVKYKFACQGMINLPEDIKENDSLIEYGTIINYNIDMVVLAITYRVTVTNDTKWSLCNLYWDI